MHIRRSGSARTGAVDEVEPRVDAAFHELAQGDERALSLPRLMSGVDLLQAQHIRIQRRQNRPQLGSPRLEPEGIGGGDVEAFEVEGGEAQGHWGVGRARRTEPLFATS